MFNTLPVMPYSFGYTMPNWQAANAFVPMMPPVNVMNNFGGFDYNQTLNNILFTTNFYNEWNNIPLFPTVNFNFPTIDFSNPFKMKELELNLDKKTWDTVNNASNASKNVNPSLYQAGYDFVNGQKLANIAKQNIVGWTKSCARHVKNDIQKAGLGKYESGHATDCDAILDRNPNFVRVNASLEDLKKTPGLVLVYKKGVAGYHKQYGHIEITGGDGCAYSDGKTRNIKPGAIVYAPVKSSKTYKA